MKKSIEKQREDQLKAAKKRLKENQELLNELKADKNKIYESVKDFRVDAITTDNAIKQMKSKDCEINGVKRRIRNDKAKVKELS